MKAIFKPEDANKLIVRDADINEASLIINFLDKIKKGATLEAQAIFNGNYETNGILFTITEKSQPVEVPGYLKINATITNDELNLPLFKITVTPATPSYLSYKIDGSLWAPLKTTLEALGLTNPSISSDGSIIANNETNIPISASIVIPKGLFQYLNVEDSTTNNFNDNLVITLGA